MNVSILGRTRAFALATAVFPPFAAAQAGSVQTLVRAGDVLPNGQVVDSIATHGVASDGRWGAVVATTAGTDALVGSGGTFVAEGATLPDGEVIDRITRVAVGPGGAIALLYEVVDPAGTTDIQARLSIGGVVVLREDDAVNASGLPAGTSLFGLADVDVAAPFVIVRASLDVPGVGLRDAFLKYEVTGSGVVADLLLLQGETPPACPGPAILVDGEIDVAQGGATIAAFAYDPGGLAELAVLVDGVTVLHDGSPGPIPGSTWDPSVRIGVAIAGPDTYAIGARLRLADSSVVGTIANATDVVARVGTTVEPVGEPILPFVLADVESFITDQVVHGARFASGRSAVAVSGTSVLVSGDTIDDGSTVTEIALEQEFAVQSPPGGQFLTLRATLDGTDEALLLVDRAAAGAVACGVVPNSTGVPGRIRGVGSDLVAANDLTLFAFDLPPSAFGYMNTSNAFGFTANPGGSAGNLCLAGSIGRYIAQIGFSGDEGSIVTTVDFTILPQPTGSASAVVGETWGFQLWHRDAAPGGGATSNFTQAVAVTLR